jgi:cytosine/adenosine deaminase-related metal-dependent hydrolase
MGFDRLPNPTTVQSTLKLDLVWFRPWQNLTYITQHCVRDKNLVSFTIQGALIPVENGYATVDVQIEGDRITAIADQLTPLGTVVNGHHKLLLPGFVNAHTHSSELWQRGLIPPRPLELWLAELYDFTPLDPEQVYLSALGTAVETLLTGGTSVVDHLVLIPGREEESIAAAVRAYREARPLPAQHCRYPRLDSGCGGKVSST